MNYNFSRKRHWRRSLWNCIAERVAVPKRDALALYLAGNLDEDRAVATAKGFSGDNLIALEHDKDVGKALRQRGTLTLIGDAFEHLFAWNPTRQIDVVALDLCNGFTQKTTENIEKLLALQHTRNAVIAVNMLRGRDASGNELRSALMESQRRLLQELSFFESRAVRMRVIAADDFQSQLARELGGDPTKHRGSLLQMMVTRSWLMWCLIACGAIDDHGNPTGDKEATDDAGRRFALAIKRARFQTLTYRSTASQTFDTLVFCNSIGDANVYFDRHALAAECGLHKLAGHRQQQAAILAHRTRRVTRPNHASH